MSEYSRNGRNKKSNRVTPEKSVITKKGKLVWIIILVIFVVLICFTLFLKFIGMFVHNELIDSH